MGLERIPGARGSRSPPSTRKMARSTTRSAPTSASRRRAPVIPLPFSALGELAHDRGDAGEAMRHLKRALPLVPAADRERTLRLLLTSRSI